MSEAHDFALRYLTVSQAVNHGPLTDEALNGFGKQGWRLVTMSVIQEVPDGMSAYHYIFLQHRV